MRAGKSLKLANGNEVYLAPGARSELQIAIIEKFVPRYLADATMLFLGDIANKIVVCEQERLEQLGVPITTHKMLADIILYNQAKHWLYLIKTGTSFGFISHKQLRELEMLLERCTAKRVYISVFPTIAEYRQYTKHIAWGSHVWIAEIPEHMIHHD